MNMGMLGMRGRQSQWTSMIEAAMATKMNQLGRKDVHATPVSAAMCATKGQTVAEKNRAALAAALAPPKNQTVAEKNRAALAAALKK